MTRVLIGESYREPKPHQPLKRKIGYEVEKDVPVSTDSHILQVYELIVIDRRQRRNHLSGQRPVRRP